MRAGETRIIVRLLPPTDTFHTTNYEYERRLGCTVRPTLFCWESLV